MQQTTYQTATSRSQARMRLQHSVHRAVNISLCASLGVQRAGAGHLTVAPSPQLPAHPSASYEQPLSAPLPAAVTENVSGRNHQRVIAYLK